MAFSAEAGFVSALREVAVLLDPSIAPKQSRGEWLSVPVCPWSGLFIVWRSEALYQKLVLCILVHSTECLVGEEDGIQTAGMIQHHPVILGREQRAG